MAKKAKRYSADFKQDAVVRLETPGRSSVWLRSSVSRRKLLYQWRDQFQAEGRAGLQRRDGKPAPGPRPRPNAPHQHPQEIPSRRMALAALRMLPRMVCSRLHSPRLENNELQSWFRCTPAKIISTLQSSFNRCAGFSEVICTAAMASKANHRLMSSDRVLASETEMIDFRTCNSFGLMRNASVHCSKKKPPLILRFPHGAKNPAG